MVSFDTTRRSVTLPQTGFRSGPIIRSRGPPEFRTHDHELEEPRGSRSGTWTCTTPTNSYAWPSP